MSLAGSTVVVGRGPADEAVWHEECHAMSSEKISTLGSFTWSIAEILRGDFKQSEYGKVILPFVVLRRLDCILEPTKDAVLVANAALPEGIDDATRDLFLFQAAGGQIRVYNTSPLTFDRIRTQQATQLHDNLVAYIGGFSENVRDIFFDKFRFTESLKRLNDGGILWQVFERFALIDLHPNAVSNLEMGYVFEDLIRRFSEISNETAGEHFTPREVIRLIVDLLTDSDAEALAGSGIIRTVYDPAAGTGGMLALTEERIKGFNSGTRVELYGQELNAESFGICQSDMLVTGHDPANIAFGNTLTEDAHAGKTFHYMLSNPPYGVDWKKYQDPIKAEHEKKGFDGRFGAGLPRVSDGQLLFLMHMIAKMRDDALGSRIGIVMNGSPLFTGGAGSGESEIRRWMLENDWVEAIVALPTDLFYNTGIHTYVWVLTNRKHRSRQGRVQLIDASSARFWQPMRKSLGSKRREISEKGRAEIIQLYHDLIHDGEMAKVFPTTAFGYREIRVERPLRLAFEVTPERLDALESDRALVKLDGDERWALRAVLVEHLIGRFTDREAFETTLAKVLAGAGLKLAAPVKKAIAAALGERDASADICRDGKGQPEPDPELRDYELVPLTEDWRDYLVREVMPFIPDAWVDESYRDEHDGQVGRVGYEINFNRYFYKYVPPRPLEEIDEEPKRLEVEIAGLLQEVVA
jgi:type I restriction enzyme M protein